MFLDGRTDSILCFSQTIAKKRSKVGRTKCWRWVPVNHVAVEWVMSLSETRMTTAAADNNFLLYRLDIYYLFMHYFSGDSYCPSYSHYQCSLVCFRPFGPPQGTVTEIFSSLIRSFFHRFTVVVNFVKKQIRVFSRKGESTCQPDM